MEEEKITVENFERLFGIKNVCGTRVIVEGKDGKLFGGKVSGFPCNGGMYEISLDDGGEIPIVYKSIKKIIQLPETRAIQEKMYDKLNKYYTHKDVRKLLSE